MKYKTDRNKQSAVSRNQGFTLMEIVVSTTIFVIVFMGLLSLFNYTLKINRRAEALRQASQGMRDFVESLVKEVRNGQIDYDFVDPNAVLNSSLPSPCVNPLSPPSPGTATYSAQDNKLGIINVDGTEECYYYANAAGSYVGAGTVTGGATLVLAKGTLAPQILNPPNITISNLMFFIRPTTDPYSYAGSGLVKFAPVVSIIVKFISKLPTGEQVPIYYQTSVTSNQYDIPNQ